MCKALTREQVEKIVRLLQEKLHFEYWPGLINLRTNDEQLRTQLTTQTERAEKAERIGGNAVAQVSFMVTEINQAFGLPGPSSPADTVQTCREARSMLDERDELRTKVADLTAKLEASEAECASWRKVLADERAHAAVRLAAVEIEQVEELALKIANGKVVGYLNRLVDSHESLRTQLAASEHRCGELEDTLDNYQKYHEAQATVTAQAEEMGQLKDSIEKLLTFKQCWEKAYRDECRYHSNKKTGEDRQSFDRRIAGGRKKG